MSDPLPGVRAVLEQLKRLVDHDLVVAPLDAAYLVADPERPEEVLGIIGEERDAVTWWPTSPDVETLAVIGGDALTDREREFRHDETIARLANELAEFDDKEGGEP